MTEPDIFETFDFGYDPSVPEDIPIGPPPPSLPSPLPFFTLNPQLLPPVGHQTTPSCFVWSSTYGCATYMAAALNKLDPSQSVNQASPIYTYIKVQEQQGDASNGNCVGGKIAWCFEFLKS